MDREVDDPARVVGRADETELETREGLLRHQGFGFIGCGVLRLLGEDIGGGQKNEDRKGQDEDAAHGFPSQE